MSELEIIGISTIYLLALVNPMSKVSILAALIKERDVQLYDLAFKSSIVAGGILFLAMIVGDFLLRLVFRVDLYSLQIAGGVVVFLVGLNALRRGIFFEHDSSVRINELALVPLACPMIAGPATIAACIGLRSQHGLLIPTVAMILALGMNHIIMLFSPVIGRILGRFNVLGALIRITGLIVMTIGTQMVLEGLFSWIKGNPL